MSPPSDGARPVVWQTRLADHHGWLDCTEGQFEDHRKHGFQVRALYTAADYDALRAEVERLTKLSDAISRDCNQTANERNEQRARAEAAEAKVDEANDRLHEIRRLAERLTKQYQIDVARELFAALNEGDGE